MDPDAPRGDEARCEALLTGMPRVEATYHDGFGRLREVPARTLELVREALADRGPAPRPLVVRAGERACVGPAGLRLEDGTWLDVPGALPEDLPLGYHRLFERGSERSLIVSPGRCPLPPRRAWGWAVQLWAARSRASWGMGDLADLRRLGAWASGLGAGMMLTSPLLAVAPTAGQQRSPYYPASRRFLNPIYLRVEEVPGAEAVADTLSHTAAASRVLCEDPHVDRGQVWRLKLRALEAIWSAGTDTTAFDAWREAGGEALERFAVWCVLAEQHGPDWRAWPAELRHPDSASVRRAAAERPERIRVPAWLQGLAREQLARAAAAGPLLLQDLPVGFDRGGADAWALQDLLALDFSIGAPPDEFNRAGQEWGLPPFLPSRLAAAGYEPFAHSVRAALTAGGVRVDHVMGLFRQFWVPAGASPEEGAYVRYPASDLLDVLALESHRAGAVVVGEDLGTVEPGVREEMAARGVLGYRVLWFEPEDPETWPELSLASVTTHDLPTVAGVWTGADLEEQAAAGLDPGTEGAARIRAALARRTGLREEDDAARAVVEVYRLLARAPSRLLCAALDDAALARRRANLPGADAVRPNWSLALPRPIEDLETDPVVLEVAARLRAGAAARPAPPVAGAERPGAD
ncbi:MAG TPA: 4-alpha-glucanotransferase [Longimicrobiales bacterium]|nr:4-alpha-glucanotransferase [Longimicrobiales bacterium]